jgi:asparagine synthase (glutamine-hydrolysing)
MLRTEPYWAVRVAEGQRVDEVEYLEELHRLLDDSVRLRLRSDVPLGAFLSGGIDSSTVVALASRHVTSPLKTFSVGFAARDFDESSYARLVADRFRTEHYEIRVDDLDASILPELVAHFDEPFGDSSAIPTYYITREARRHVTVCLSGDGGDEIFAGYTQYAAALRERWIDLLPQGLRRRLFGWLADRLPDHVHGKGWLQRVAATGAERYQRHVGVFDPKARRALFLPEWARYVSEDALHWQDYFGVAGGHPVSVCQQIDQMSYLPEDILVKVDRTSMKHALEVRVPMLDHRVVEWANAKIGRAHV